MPAFEKCILRSIEDLRLKCDKGEFDIQHHVTHIVMNAVLSESKSRSFQINCNVRMIRPNRYDFRKGNLGRYRRENHDEHRKVSSLLFVTIPSICVAYCKKFVQHKNLCPTRACSLILNDFMT